MDCRWSQYRRGLGQQLFHQLFRGREFRLDQLDLIAGQLGQLGGRRDGLGLGAEFIDQTQLLGIQTTPDSALRYLVHRLRAHFASLGHQLDESLIGVLDVHLDHLLDVIWQRPARIDAGELGGGDAIGMDTDIFQRLVDGGKQSEDADGAGDRRRLGHDAVGIGGDPVAPGGGHAAHRDHHRLAGCLHGQQFGADLLGGKGAAAGAVDAQHQGLDALILGDLAQQTGEGLPADAAGGLVAILDGAGGDNQADAWLVLLGVAVGLTPQIVAEPDVLITHLVLADAGKFGNRLNLFVVSGQFIDQLLLQGIGGGVALGGLEPLQQLLLVRVDGIGGDFARLGRILDIGLPQLIQPAAVGLARLGGHVIPGVGLDEGLVGADPEYVGGDVEFFQRRLVVEVVQPQPLDHHGTRRIEQDLIGVGGQQILMLDEEVAAGDHRFAAAAEVIQRPGDLTEFAQVARLQILQLQHDPLDLGIVAGLLDGIDHIADQGLRRWLIASQPFLHQAAGGILHAALLNQLTGQIQHQGAALGLQLLLFIVTEYQDDQDQQHQKYQIDDELTGEVQPAPTGLQ